MNCVARKCAGGGTQESVYLYMPATDVLVWLKRQTRFTTCTGGFRPSGSTPKSMAARPLIKKKLTLTPTIRGGGCHSLVAATGENSTSRLVVNKQPNWHSLSSVPVLLAHLRAPIELRSALSHFLKPIFYRKAYDMISYCSVCTRSRVHNIGSVSTAE